MNIGFVLLCVVMICIFTATRQDRQEARAWFRRHNAKFVVAAIASWSFVLLLYMLGRR